MARLGDLLFQRAINLAWQAEPKGDARKYILAGGHFGGRSINTKSVALKFFSGTAQHCRNCYQTMSLGTKCRPKIILFLLLLEGYHFPFSVSSPFRGLEPVMLQSCHFLLQEPQVQMTWKSSFQLRPSSLLPKK